MRLIDADELLRLSHRFHISEFDRDGVEIIYADTVRNAPTVKVQKTGKWIKKIIPSTLGYYECECSECGRMWQYREGWNYCPNCGAKMVGEGK